MFKRKFKFSSVWLRKCLARELPRLSLLDNSFQKCIILAEGKLNMGKIAELVRKELESIDEELFNQIGVKVFKDDYAPSVRKALIDAIVSMVSEPISEVLLKKHFAEELYDDLLESVMKHIEDWAEKKLEESDFTEMVTNLAEKVRGAAYSDLPEFLEEACAKLALKLEL